MATRLAIFDCDGTLVDGQHEVCAAMESAFASSGLVAPRRAVIRRIVGLSLPNALRHLAPDTDEDTRAHIVDEYKSAFRRAREAGTLREPLFGGIEQLLRDLTATDWTLGVATGKSERGLTACLADHGLSSLFATLQTADHHPSKPHPAMLEVAMAEAGAEPDNCVMIGDTTFDIEMARNANVRAIGVAWGYHSAEELTEFGAEAIAQTPADLLEILG